MKRFLLIASLVLFYGISFGQSTEQGCVTVFDTLTGREIFKLVDVMPEYDGGFDTLLKFIGENLKYPDIATCISGRVYIKFIVEPDGQVTSFRVLRSVSRWADKEALRVLEKMPNWKPGKCNGETVPVEIILPIGFTFE